MGFFTVLLSAIAVVVLVVWFVWATDEEFEDEDEDSGVE